MTGIRFANPFLICHWCGREVTGVTSDGRNVPCDHIEGTVSMCPSWGPVDGCICSQTLGRVPHKGAPAGAR